MNCRARPLTEVAVSFLVAVGIGTAIGCTPPIGVKRISIRDEHVQQNRNALTANEPSDAAQIILRRYDLVDRYASEPALALSRLRDIVITTGGSDELYALAELSYLHSARTSSRTHALAAAVYAFAFLFPNDRSAMPSTIDPRYRWACDIYAEGLTAAFKEDGGRTLALKGGAYPLPFGTLTVAFDPQDLVWGSRMLTDLVPVSEYEIYGMRNHYRQPGLGIPLAARTIALPDQQATVDKLVDEQIRVPATAVLLLADPRRQIANTDLHGRLQVYAAVDRENVEVDGATVPLEIDRTATVAITLTETQFWKRELSGFLGQVTGVRKTARLLAREPYRPGRIPVVLVHGTNSSPGRWADMVNDLENDPRIRHRYVFWFFTYDSGNPIAYSAMLLRRALKDAVTTFDPQGRDACLHEMVVIGHSQGGLLTKMTAIDSGDAFWRTISEMPFDEVRLSEQSRALLNEALFVEPLPFVSRVVFIATPHRGSYMASSQLVRRLAFKLISMPREITALGSDMLAVRDPTKRIVSLERLPTSIDNMSPGNRFIRTLAEIPISPNVPAHSIIPVESAEGPLANGVDGVVAYSSAHIDGVESERVVRPSSHSTQSNPETVDEVRRILLLHADAHPCAAAPPVNTSPLQPTSP